MATFKAPVERAREKKRFLTVREVEDLAAAKAEEIIHTPDLVITDAAREVAIDLGIRIVSDDEVRRRASKGQSSAIPAVRGDTAPARSPGQAVPATGLEVKPANAGTQRPADAGVAAPQSSDDALVRAIVDAIRARWRPTQRYSRQLLGPDKT
jgi:hypothetical protein